MDQTIWALSCFTLGFSVNKCVCFSNNKYPAFMCEMSLVLPPIDMGPKNEPLETACSNLKQ